MDKDVSAALGEFFSGQKKLNQLGIIHSRDYIGDIGRYLCQQVYGMEVPGGRPQPGYDGTIGPSRVAVRINNCPTGTPVRAGGCRQRLHLLPVHSRRSPGAVQGDQRRIRRRAECL